MSSVFFLLSGLGIIYLVKDKLFDSNLANNNIKDFLNKKDVILIDVRSKDEFDVGHFNKAINIPHKEINQNSVNRIRHKCSYCRYLIYCRSGRRAKIAFNKFRKLGLKNVYYTTYDFKTLQKKTN